MVIIQLITNKNNFTKVNFMLSVIFIPSASLLTGKNLLFILYTKNLLDLTKSESSYNFCLNIIPIGFCVKQFC